MTLKWKWRIDVAAGRMFILNIDTWSQFQEKQKIVRGEKGASSETICNVRISRKPPITGARDNTPRNVTEATTQPRVLVEFQ